MPQCCNEQIGTLPAIKAEQHFVQVGREMLCAEFVRCADDAAPEQAKPAAPLTDTDDDILLTTGHFSDLRGCHSASSRLLAWQHGCGVKR